MFDRGSTYPQFIVAGVWILALACLSFATAASPLSPPVPQDTDEFSSILANDLDSRLIDGLRIRRLFDLAERHCRKLLATPNLTPAQTARYTIELIKTQTARAILNKPTERDSTWLQAEQTAAEFLAQNPRHPRSFLVRAQSALSHLAHGRLLRQELAAEMVAESAREKALSELRQARSLLSELQRDISKAIPENRNRTLSTDELSTEELLTLNKNIRYQLAIANVNRAQIYAPSDRLNRIEALNQVLEALAGVQRETSTGQPLWWESRILQIECLRLLDRTDQASDVLNQLLDAVSDGKIPQSLLEQQLKLSVETGNTKASIEALSASEKLLGREPQLDLSRLATVVNLATRSTGNEKQQWLVSAAQMTRQIEKRHGDYWGRRAELVLINSSAANSAITNSTHSNSSRTPATSTELDLLIRLADQASRKKRFADAVKAYDLAANTARELGDADRMFALTVRASRALEQQNLHGQAAERLIDLANLNADRKNASAAHLRGCWNRAQDVGGDPQKRQQFRELLEQHLARWPDADSANQVRVWLGGEDQRASQWKSAFEHYVSVSPDSSLFGDAISRAGYCASRWTKHVEPKNREAVIQEVTDRLNAVWLAARDSTTAKFDALLSLTDFGIQHGSVTSDQLIQPLEDLVAASPLSDQKNMAKAWLLVCLASDPEHTKRTDEFLAQISQDINRLELAEKGLAAVLQRRGNSDPSQLSQMRLKLIEAALNNELPERKRTVWLFRKSDALSDLGQNSEALAVLTTLEQELPRNAGIKLRIARLITREFSRSDPEKAISTWRRLAIQLKPHTANWYEAKFNIAALLEQSGKKAEARKLLEYMQAIPPGWDNSDLRESFDQLLNKCK